MEGETPKIYEAIIGVINDIGAVGKDARNDQGKYQYRSIDALVSALNPVMAKNKVFVAPEIIEEKREERKTAKGYLMNYVLLKIKYRFYTVDGSYIEVVMEGEAFDSGDKATNKAMTAAYKYALSEVFAVPTYDIDADGEEPELTVPMEVKEKPSEMHMQALFDLAKQKGFSDADVLKAGHIKSLDQMDFRIYTDLVNRLNKQPDRAVEEEQVDLGL